MHLAVNLIFELFQLQGGDVVCEGRDDMKDFSDIRSAMKVLMYTDEEIWDILKILAALLHIGNITYKATMVDNIDASEIVAKDCVNKAARLLEVGMRCKDLECNAFIISMKIIIFWSKFQFWWPSVLIYESPTWVKPCFF